MQCNLAAPPRYSSICFLTDLANKWHSNRTHQINVPVFAVNGLPASVIFHLVLARTVSFCTVVHRVTCCCPFPVFCSLQKNLSTHHVLTTTEVKQAGHTIGQTRFANNSVEHHLRSTITKLAHSRNWSRHIRRLKVSLSRVFRRSRSPSYVCVSKVLKLLAICFDDLGFLLCTILDSVAMLLGTVPMQLPVSMSRYLLVVQCCI